MAEIDININKTNKSIKSVSNIESSQNEMNSLILEIADNYGIELKQNLNNRDIIISNSIELDLFAALRDQDELFERLAKLKQL